MSSTSFNLRNIAPKVMLLLKKDAAKQKISVNSLILQIIEQRLGIAYPTRSVIFHDLDYLAGTWNDQDKKAFDESIKAFESLDKELWS